MANASAKATALRSQSAHKTLGIIEDAATDPAAVYVTNSATAAAKAAGWSVLLTDAEDEPSKAVAGMEDYVARGVTGLLVEIFVSSELTNGLKAARAAHIPVVTWGGGLAPGIAASYDENGGTVAAEGLMKAMGGKDVGSILDITYHGGLPCREREASFTQFMSQKYPNIKISRFEINLETADTQAVTYTNGWLAKKPKSPLGMFVCFDDPAVAAAREAQVLGYKPGEIKVASFNAEPIALAAIKSGYETGSLWFNSTGDAPSMFRTLEQVIKAGTSWRPITVQIASVWVTRSNLVSFEAKYGKNA
jgi:ribose transport system substrate-binding protein